MTYLCDATSPVPSVRDREKGLVCLSVSYYFKVFQSVLASRAIQSVYLYSFKKCTCSCLFLLFILLLKMHFVVFLSYKQVYIRSISNILQNRTCFNLTPSVYIPFIVSLCSVNLYFCHTCPRAVCMSLSASCPCDVCMSLSGP